MQPVLPRTRLVWIVAGATALEAIGEFVTALLERKFASAGVWVAVAFCIFFAAGFVENVKALGGD